MNKMKPAHRMLLAALLCSALCAGAGCPARTPAGVENVSPAQLNEMLGRDGVVVIDVREPSELKTLPPVHGARNIPLGKLESRLGELDRDASYVLTCRTGNRSTQAARIMSRNGFHKLYNLEGGMTRYRAHSGK